MIHSASPIESLEPRLAPAGIVLVSTNGSHLTITGDDADNIINIVHLENGRWQIDANDDTLFKLNGGAAVARLEFNEPVGNVAINTRGGGDTVSLVNLNIQGSLRITTHDGNDAVSILDGYVKGSLSVDLGNGDDNMGTEGEFHSTVTILGGTGDDQVAVNAGTYAKGLTLNLGTGSNALFITSSANSTQIGQLNVKGNITISSAGGISNVQNYEMTVEHGIISGSVSISTTRGATNLLIGNGAGDLNILGNFNFTGGTGDNTITAQHAVAITGGLSLRFRGTSENLVTFADEADISLGSIAYHGSAGNDMLKSEGADLHLRNGVWFNGGRGSDAFQVTGEGSIYMGAGITFFGEDLSLTSEGPATILGAVRFENNTAGGSLVIAGLQLTRVGSIQYTGSNAGDLGNSTFVYINNAEVFGDVNVLLAKGGNLFNLLTSTVHGNVSVHSSSKELYGMEILTLEIVDIRGSLALISTGDAPTEASLNDVTINKTCKIDTGAGSDIVSLDFQDVDPNQLMRASEFRGGVTINLGAGDDILQTGRSPLDADNRNFFSKYLRIDGGSGNDTATVLTGFGNTFVGGITPVITHVEDLT